MQNGNAENYALSVIVPCFNEAGNIPELVRRLLRVFHDHSIAGEVLLIDDGSSDDTASVIRQQAERFPAEVVGLFHPQNKGLEQGWRTGLKAARGKYGCIIDADLQYQPEDVWRLYQEHLFSRADIVQGARSSIGQLHGSRYILSIGLNLVLNSLFGMHLKDNKSGFLLAPLGVLREMMRHRYKYSYYQILICVCAASKGYSIRDIDVLFESRLVGQSFMPRFPLKVVLGCVLDLVKGFVEFRVRKKRENLTAEFLEAERSLSTQAADKAQTLGALSALGSGTVLQRFWGGIPAKYYAELSLSQDLNKDQIRSLQELKLKRLILQAYTHNGYYRNVLDKLGIKAADISSIEDLKHLPLLSRQSVQQNLYFGLLSDNYDKKAVRRVLSGGSVGVPAIYYLDRHQRELGWAANLRGMNWAGFTLNKTLGSLVCQLNSQRGLSLTYDKVRTLSLKRRTQSFSEDSVQAVRTWLSEFQQMAPAVLEADAQLLEIAAEHLGEGAPNLQFLKGLIVDALYVTADYRAKIKSVFGCSVFARYEHPECRGIAHECLQGGLHLSAENYAVEILVDGRPAKPGEVGDVVVSDLNNFCMPLIRYNIGDRALCVEDAPCPCGCSLPLLGQIELKVPELLRGAEGRFLTAAGSRKLMDEYAPFVNRYEFLQNDRDRISLGIEKGARCPADLMEELKALFESNLGVPIEVEALGGVQNVE